MKNMGLVRFRKYDFGVQNGGYFKWWKKSSILVVNTTLLKTRDFPCEKITR